MDLGKESASLPHDAGYWPLRISLLEMSSKAQINTVINPSFLLSFAGRISSLVLKACVAGQAASMLSVMCTETIPQMSAYGAVGSQGAG